MHTMETVRRTCALLVLIASFTRLTLCSRIREDLRQRLFQKRDMLRMAKRAGVGENKLFFKGSVPEVTLARHHEDVVLECEVGGSPSPTIHWLKNGDRIEQGSTHDFRDDDAIFEDKVGLHGEPLLRLGKIKSKLYIDCATEQDAAVYTCVADTQFERITRATVLKLDSSLEYESKASCMVKKAFRGEPARIFLWTSVRLELEGAAVQLYCRAEGHPKPKITWFDTFEEEIVSSNDSYQLLPNGDLLIKDISWMNNMGSYVCKAENPSGVDEISTFLYPTALETEK